MWLNYFQNVKYFFAAFGKIPLISGPEWSKFLFNVDID